ncbi:FAD-binding oxidoreductase [[Bacillus] enclensis]|uniref:FAD-binding oxidoreductase n=1 Tax=[Bacillus] enclensis TaxID=1402860 RepID=UPI0018DC2616|nr:FAD-linked oxidase C-terminal domain-containing protein [[Bacillus] enclensis]MBH9967962.1 FAD-binding protein [[Bacillus] enclensis]
MNTAWIADLQELIGLERVSTSEGDLFRHGRDESFHEPVEPDIVVFPDSTNMVKAVVDFARGRKIPITPYGAGSGLDGQAIPVSKGISMNFDSMKKVVSFNPEDLSVTVQPGITRLELNREINRHGLYFPIDPGADATIGGMTATNASGTTAVRYGSMRDQVLNLEVVLADGRIIRTGSFSKKSSSGYHLNGLFTGSEGTLGIITEITLKLHGIPEHKIAARCTFNSPKECATAAQTVLTSGIPVLRMELVDALSIKQVNAYGDYGFPEHHSLFFEFAGTKTSTEEEAIYVEELMKDMGCANWERASGSIERAEIWKARHELSYAFRHLKGKEVVGSDVCVPISKLADIVDFARSQIEASGLLGSVFGHVGDGNFHTIIVYDPAIPEEKEASEKINENLILRAIEAGGTCTGEHGVGLGKIKYQRLEHGDALDVMKSFKDLLDPDGLLNPGKIVLDRGTDGGQGDRSLVP